MMLQWLIHPIRRFRIWRNYRALCEAMEYSEQRRMAFMRWSGK
jgi:hypothetical protein